ncbi:MAG TPA: ABC transporter permease [Nitrososphaerales archaeon]|nr:ABC transporter permease [Nitrososphaerales archaeon]
MAERKFLSIFDRQETAITWRILRSSLVTTAGLVIIVGFLGLSFVLWLTNDSILPYNPTAITSNVLQAPSLTHLLGTDSLGRDVFSRVLAAAPIDARVPLAVLSVAIALGLVTGTIAGYFGGLVEEIVMRITDIFLAFPGIVLALAIAAALGPNINNSILALAPVWWPSYTRLVRGETLSIKTQQYVEASRAAGHKSRYIVVHHIIPNILPVILVYATLDFGNVIVVFSVLSFIGLGAQPPASEWGLMTVQQEQFLTSSPWIPLAPAIAILLVAVGFSLVGDGLRDALDPKVRSLFG